MGRYKVFYFEDLDRGEVIIGCPVCKRIERNFIEPVAVILEEEDYNEEIENQLTQLKSLEELKENKELLEKILNKDDLVCILHQKKEGKHWEEDTEEFREWNRIIDKENLYVSTINDSLNKGNLINQFWRRVRAYRFVVDYKQEWENIARDWESFKKKIINKKVDTNEIEKENRLISLYLNGLDWNWYIYVFSKVIFPIFTSYGLGYMYKAKENSLQRTKLNLNFWYKDETLIFQRDVDFSLCIFHKEIDFNKTIFQNKASFSDTKFKSWVNFRDAFFKSKVDFFNTHFQKNATFSEVIFQKEIDFRKALFKDSVHFKKAFFKGKVYFSEAIFQKENNFSETSFQDIAYFIMTKFKNTSDFSWATFHKKVYFIDCEGANLILKEINLNKKNHFEINKCNFIAIKFVDFVNHTDNFLVLNSGINTGLKKEFAKEKLKQFLGKYLKTKDEKLENAVNLFLEGIEKSFSDDITKVRNLIETEDNEEKVKEEFQRLAESVNTYFTKFLFENFLTIKQLHTQSALRELFIPKKRKEEGIIQVFKRKKEIIIDILGLITPFSYLEIDNCTLNNMKFLNCDFSQAERITIKNSFIEDVVFNNVDWGDISEKRISPELFEENPKSARDIYRQIKHALDKHSDHINANWFYALEMRAYEKYLDRCVCIKNNGEKCQQKKSELYKDFIIFKIHKVISNFGQSWVRPLVLILFLTTLMMSCGVKIDITNSKANLLDVNLLNKYSCFYEEKSNKNSQSKDIKKIEIRCSPICYISHCYIPHFIIKLYIFISIAFIIVFTVFVFSIILSILIDLKNSPSFLKPLFYSALIILIIFSLIFYINQIFQLGYIKSLFIFLDNFATTLNVFNIFGRNVQKYFDGYLFLYKIYAIFILVLIYQLILAIRRRVRR